MYQAFPRSIGYLEKTLKILLPENKMPQSFDIWYVASHLVVLYRVCSNCGYVVKMASSWMSQSLH